MQWRKSLGHGLERELICRPPANSVGTVGCFSVCQIFYFSFIFCRRILHSYCAKLGRGHLTCCGQWNVCTRHMYYFWAETLRIGTHFSHVSLPMALDLSTLWLALLHYPGSWTEGEGVKATASVVLVWSLIVVNFVSTGVDHSVPTYLTEGYFWVRVFPDEISTWITGLGKVYCSSHCSGVSSNTKRTRGRRRNSPTFCPWAGTFHFIFFCLWTGIYNMTSLGSQAFRLGLNHRTSVPGFRACRFGDVSDSIIARANFLLSIYLHMICSVSLENHD